MRVPMGYVTRSIAQLPSCVRHPPPHKANPNPAPAPAPNPTSCVRHPPPHTANPNLLGLGPATANGIAIAPLAPRAPTQGLIAQGTSPVHFVALAHAAGFRNRAICRALLQRPYKTTAFMTTCLSDTRINNNTLLRSIYAREHSITNCSPGTSSLGPF